MQYWILKTDPDTYALADLEREHRTRWDGVANPVAVKHLRSMRAGDRAFIYHTGDDKAIVGLARIVSDGYADPRDPKLAVVDVEFERAVGTPVTLAAVKADPAFKDLGLVRQGRLSVVPVPEVLWKRLLTMGELQ
ncbi:MAG: EVE domain-containing protein [Gemmatimonadales bacterium]